jgi:molybdate transport system substrate-binding protein
VPSKDRKVAEVGRSTDVLQSVLLIVTLLAASVLALGCEEGDSNDSSDSTDVPATGSEGVSGDLTVFAASSLIDAFEEIGSAFGAANPEASIEFNFAGSPALRTQLEEGAPADVLAVADENNMQLALDDGSVIDAGQTFARNRLAIIVPSDNPAGIETPFDLGNDSVRLVLAGEDVPVGNYARQSIDLIGQQPDAPDGYADAALDNVVSNEPNAKAVVTKVQLGEADAGIVYVTDVTPDLESDVSTIEIPDEVNVIASYPIAVTSEAAATDVAQEFIDFVLSEEGQAILRDFRFLPVE